MVLKKCIKFKVEFFKFIFCKLSDAFLKWNINFCNVASTLIIFLQNYWKNIHSVEWRYCLFQINLLPKRISLHNRKLNNLQYYTQWRSQRGGGNWAFAPPLGARQAQGRSQRGARGPGAPLKNFLAPYCAWVRLVCILNWAWNLYWVSKIRIFLIKNQKLH